ncbi:MAG: hypothetical protein H0W83_00235 [Planctomycetes bacterium]|nr:hypothetical protein [Planctomycetota bacterium]
MQMRNVNLSTADLFVTGEGAVISVLRISRDQDLYVGSDKRVYSGDGQYVRHGYRAIPDTRDIVQDAASLGPDEGTSDIHWAICRSVFTSSSPYHTLIELAETEGLDESRILYFLDRWLGENLKFSRFRECLAIMCRHLTEIERDDA